VPGRLTGLLAHRRVKMECLGIRGALPSGRTECVPPRKPPFALSQGFPRKAIRARITNPAEGRAPHARKGGHDANPNVAFFCHHALANEPVTVTCLGLRPALPRGRGDRAPPRKPPQRHLRAFHRKAILPWTALPAEGRAPHAGQKRPFPHRPTSPQSEGPWPSSPFEGGEMPWRTKAFAQAHGGHAQRKWAKSASPGFPGSPSRLHPTPRRDPSQNALDIHHP
jgi:hypothetical protein